MVNRLGENNGQYSETQGTEIHWVKVSGGSGTGMEPGPRSGLEMQSDLWKEPVSGEERQTNYRWKSYSSRRNSVIS